MNKMEKQLVVFLNYVQGSSRSPIIFFNTGSSANTYKIEYLALKKGFCCFFI